MTRRAGTRVARGNAAVRVMLLVILLAIAAAIAWGGITYVHFTRTPLAVRSAGQTLEIAKGEGFRGIVAQLRREQLSDAPPLLWRALAWRLGVASKLHAGEYALTPGMTLTLWPVQTSFPTVTCANISAVRSSRAKLLYSSTQSNDLG